MLNQRIRQLVDYGIRTGLISEYERIYTTNLLLEIFQEPEYTEPENPGEEDLPEILAGLLDEAAKRGTVSYTHLDVYKRQMYTENLRQARRVRKHADLGECAAGILPTGLMLQEDHELERNVIHHQGEKRFIGVPLGLDVYKRQVYGGV